MPTYLVRYKLDAPAVITGFDGALLIGEGSFEWTGSLVNGLDHNLYEIEWFDSGPIVTSKSQEEINALIIERGDMDLADQLKIDVNMYINAHYDQGYQSSFQAYYGNITKSIAEGDVPVFDYENKLDRIESVWAWINIVLEYYYTKKEQILGGDNTVTWDFSQFDDDDPGVKLSEFIS
jgi:hypothetical protein